MPRFAVLSACMVALGPLVVACTGPGDEGASDALHAIGTTHTLCTSSDVSSTMIQGFDTFANRGPSPVVVDRVEWLDTSGLTLEEVRVFQHAPEDRFATFGLSDTYPPTQPGGSASSKSLRSAWERSVPAEGALLGPADEESLNFYNFVIGYSGSAGRGGPLRIHYTDAEGNQGTADSLVTVRVVPDCLAE